MIKRIFLSFLVGIVITVLVMHDDPQFKQYIGNFYVRALQSSLDCTFDGTVERVNFLNSTLEFTDVSVRPCAPNQQWYWRCNKYVTSFSWWHFFVYGTVEMNLSLQGLQVDTVFQHGKLGIMPHIQKLLSGVSLAVPTFLKNLSFKDAQVCMRTADNATVFNFAINSSSKSINNIFRSSIYIKDGVCAHNNERVLQHFAGSLYLDSFKQGTNSRVFMRTSGNFVLPRLPEHAQHCFVNGVWRDKQGTFSIKNSDETLLCEPLTITSSDEVTALQFSADMPLAHIVSLLQEQYDSSLISGTCKTQVTITSKAADTDIQATVIAQDIMYGTKKLCSLGKITGHKQQDSFAGTVHIKKNKVFDVDGTWKYDIPEKTGFLHCANTVMMSVPATRNWHVFPRDCTLDFQLQQDNVVGAFTCAAHNKKLQQEKKVEGSFNYTPDIFSLHGTFDNNVYDLACTLQPHLQLQHFDYKDAQGNSCIALQATSDTKFKGTITFPFVRNFLTTLFAYDVPGQGNVQVHGTVHHEYIAAKVFLDNAHIRLPKTYNFIDDFSALLCFSTRDHTLIAKDVHLGLHRGDVHCNRGVIFFDAMMRPTFIHVPFLLDNCLLNIKKDLFALLSGYVLLKQDSDSFTCGGHVFLERSQLTSSIFSVDLHKKLFSLSGQPLDAHDNSVRLNMSVETKDPIRIKTPLLQTNVQTNVRLSGSVADPYVSGSLQLLSGTIMFPYKHLYLTQGSLHFVPTQLYDPVINVIAKNKIKKYNVTLQVAGTLNNHTISLSSTPPLTEEQIISLLLAGSDSETLSAAMPALVMQNVRNIIFGNVGDTGDPYGSSLLRPFKHVHLVPSFSDQSGRGGLRGALEIEVNEQWRALLQKNFSLSEDTRFEVEYLLSDDITLRGYRDEHRDIGGEVEMRWKF